MQSRGLKPKYKGDRASIAEQVCTHIPTPQCQLTHQARTHRRSLAHELECNLILFSEHLPAERIRELAKASQRHPDQMLIRLVLLGLRVYERAIARMDADIEASKENSLNL
jgi:hypothetical protein